MLRSFITIIEWNERKNCRISIDSILFTLSTLLSSSQCSVCTQTIPICICILHTKGIAHFKRFVYSAFSFENCELELPFISWPGDVKRRQWWHSMGCASCVVETKVDVSVRCNEPARTQDALTSLQMQMQMQNRINLQSVGRAVGLVGRSVKINSLYLLSFIICYYFDVGCHAQRINNNNRTAGKAYTLAFDQSNEINHLLWLWRYCFITRAHTQPRQTFLLISMSLCIYLHASSRISSNER